MKFAVVIRHAPAKYERPGIITCHVTSRVQRLWFRWWELRSLFHCWRSARRFYGTDRVSLERW